MGRSLHLLLDEIHELERHISERIHHTSEKPHFEVASGIPNFGETARQRFKTLKKNLIPFLFESSIWKILTAPVIYSLAVPLVLLDCFVSVYQLICFPVYRISRIRRRDYVVLDRHRLPYLNLIEKFNCVYCGYANGVLAFTREIAARTEQHWCPIKHARKAQGCHSRQCLFCEYGNAESFRKEFEQIREDFSDID